MIAPTDQATELRRAVSDHALHHAMQRGGESLRRDGAGSSALGHDASNAPQAMPPFTVAVASGKGGVGKTILSVNLAAALAKSGRRVCLVDVDPGTANADVLLNTRTSFTLDDFLAGRCDIAQARGNVAANLDLVIGSSNETRRLEQLLARRTLWRNVLAVLAVGADVVVLDCGAGVGPDVLGAIGGADLGLIVTTPEPTAITDAYALIKSLHRSEERGAHPDSPYPSGVPVRPPLRLVINQADSRRQADTVAARLATVADRFLQVHIPHLGTVTSDRHVRKALVDRQPCMWRYPRCRASREIIALAELISGSIPMARRGIR